MQSFEHTYNMSFNVNLMGADAGREVSLTGASVQSTCGGPCTGATPAAAGSDDQRSLRPLGVATARPTARPRPQTRPLPTRCSTAPPPPPRGKQPFSQTHHILPAQSARPPARSARLGAPN